MDTLETHDGGSPEPQVQRLMLVENPAELRVLGVLMEKEMSTPAYYPMTVNSITAACNQKNNRDPIVDFDEPVVLTAIEGLRKKSLVSAITGTGYRVQKYKHNATHVYNLSFPETAVLCLLILRGPQTPGELRSRSSSLHHFEGLEQVDTVVQALSTRPSPLVERLPRVTGQKEARFGHLLAGHRQPDSEAPVPNSSEMVSLERFAALEGEILGLKKEIQVLQQTLAEFRKQFE